MLHYPEGLSVGNSIPSFLHLADQDLSYGWAFGAPEISK